MSTDIVADPNQAPVSHGDNIPVVNADGKRPLANLNSNHIFKQISMILLLTICLVLVIYVVLWAQEPDYRPLGKMDSQQMVEVLDVLDKNRIDYQIELDVIKVPVDLFQQVKILLRKEGIDTLSSSNDYLNKDSGFGVSQRMERARLQFSREQNLARTIEELNSVSRAKVILAIPKENVFTRKRSKPSATVVVTTRRAALEQETVDSIVDIVSSAVEGLEPSKVTVTDSNGRLLNSGSRTGISAKARREQELVQQKEAEYRNKIEAILMPILGPENFTSQVDVAMDFTAKEETAKRYDPKSSVVRSEMTLETNSNNSKPSGVPGALTNQPPEDSEFTEIGEITAVTKESSGNKHQETTRNFEVNTVISHTQQQVGIIKRVSVSVAVNYKPASDAESPKEVRTDDELKNINDLLEGAVGFDKARGDVIKVVSVRFMEIELEKPPAASFWEASWFWKLIKLALVGFLVLIAIFAIFRPILKNIMQPQSRHNAPALESSNELAEIEDQYAAEPIGMLASPDVEYSYNEDGSIQIPNIHSADQMLKSIRALVSNETELSTLVVRNWLKEDDK